MIWRHLRREVTRYELFSNIKALVAASYDFFEHYNQRPREVLSICDCA